MNSYIANDVLAYINDCVCVYIYFERINIICWNSAKIIQLLVRHYIHLKTRFT